MPGVGGKDLDISMEVRFVLNEFLSELNERVTSNQFDRLLFGKEKLTRIQIRYKPEAYTWHNLVRPLLDTVGLHYQLQPRSQGISRDRWPDFEITNTGIPYIGEVKPINGIEEGNEEIKEYLGIEGFRSPYGILTDGVEWRIFGPPLPGGRSSNPTQRDSVNLRPALQFIAKAEGHWSMNALAKSVSSKGIGRIEGFTSTFSRDRLDAWALEKMSPEFRNEFLEKGRSLQSSLGGKWE